MLRLAAIAISIFAVFTGCRFAAATDEDIILGTWVREGTDGTGPAGKLHFSRAGGSYILSFDCSGSPGPGWPAAAQTAYKFRDGKLSYLNYYDNGMGFTTAVHFNWTRRGDEFEIWLNELLLYVSATYPVKYKKISQSGQASPPLLKRFLVRDPL